VTLAEVCSLFPEVVNRRSPAEISELSSAGKDLACCFSSSSMGHLGALIATERAKKNRARHSSCRAYAAYFPCMPIVDSPWLRDSWFGQKFARLLTLRRQYSQPVAEVGPGVVLSLILKGAFRDPGTNSPCSQRTKQSSAGLKLKKHGALSVLPKSVHIPPLAARNETTTTSSLAIKANRHCV
jgi:hypothetical protein